MKQVLVLVVIALTLALLTPSKFYCEDGKSKKKSDTENVNKEATKKDCKDVHWSHHKGDHGPENWKNLCDGFSDCGESAQSPINIVTSKISKGKKSLAPKFSYKNSAVEIINNGHTVQFNVSGENVVNLDGKDYKLLQFHYHALSEHTINGNHYPIEVHFVHQHSNTDFAVLGMVFNQGNNNELFSKYLDKFPTSKGVFKSADIIDVLSLFPKNKSYFNYKGSLTTPPCSEVVNWYLLETPLTASKSQIDKFSKILHNNFRPVQLLNGREIKMYNQ